MKFPICINRQISFQKVFDIINDRCGLAKDEILYCIVYGNVYTYPSHDYHCP